MAIGSDRSKAGVRWSSRTRLVAIDIDHATEAERLRTEMAQLPHTVATWVSASGAGVKTLMLVDSVGETAEEFHRAWFAARIYLEQLGYAIAHNTKVDLPGSYWTCVQFLSRDPGVYYNANPEPLRVDDFPKPPTQPSNQKAWSPSHMPKGKPPVAEVSRMLDFVRPPDLHWMGGPGEISVLSMANALEDWGGAEAEGLFYDWLARVGYNRHKPADAWRRAMERVGRVTFGSLWYWAKEGGWEPPWEPSRIPYRNPVPTRREPGADLDDSWMDE